MSTLMWGTTPQSEESRAKLDKALSEYCRERAMSEREMDMRLLDIQMHSPMLTLMRTQAQTQTRTQAQTQTYRPAPVVEPRNREVSLIIKRLDVVIALYLITLSFFYDGLIEYFAAIIVPLVIVGAMRWYLDSKHNNDEHKGSHDNDDRR